MLRAIGSLILTNVEVKKGVAGLSAVLGMAWVKAFWLAGSQFCQTLIPYLTVGTLVLTGYFMLFPRRKRTE